MPVTVDIGRSFKDDFLGKALVNPNCLFSFVNKVIPKSFAPSRDRSSQYNFVIFKPAGPATIGSRSVGKPSIKTLEYSLSVVFNFVQRYELDMN